MGKHFILLVERQFDRLFDPKSDHTCAQCPRDTFLLGAVSKFMDESRYRAASCDCILQHEFAIECKVSA